MRFAPLVLLLALPAVAQEARDPEGSQPTSSVPSDDEQAGEQTGGSTPSKTPVRTPPKRRPTVRKKPAPAVDSGFQVLLGLGGVSYQATATNDQLGSDLETTGVGPGFLLGIGWSFAPSVAIGAGGVGGVISKPKSTFSGTETTATDDLQYSIVGAYVDVGHAQGDGLHVLTVLGVARLDPGGDVAAASGFGAAGGLGYRVLLDDEWSLGVIGMLKVFQVTTDDETTILGFVPGGQLALTWH